MFNYISKYVAFLLIFVSVSIFSQKKILSDFSNLDDWKIYKSEGVETSLSKVIGKTGEAIRYDYNFKSGSGYGGIQKIISLDIPENFQFTFYLRADSPNNNFEIKFLDETGENVWWMNNRNYDFPKEWTKFTVKKRHINFAWGPIIDKSFKHVSRIEFTIASYSGGKGWIELDDLEFSQIPNTSNINLSPSLTTLSNGSNSFFKDNILDNDYSTTWRSKSRKTEQINIDFKSNRELGGLAIFWCDNNFARKVDVEISDNNRDWESVYYIDNNKSNKSFIRLNGVECRYIKLKLSNSKTNRFGITEIKFFEPEETENLNNFFINIAKKYPRGFFPRYFNEEKSYWNIIGVNGDEKEGLINEDGMIEIDKSRFSIEPMMLFDKKLITWNDVKLSQTLVKKYLPIPIVKWDYDSLQLEVKSFATGIANESSVLFNIYKITNRSDTKKAGKLFLIVRPFQVNPYYQWLNIQGGVSKISSVNINEDSIKIDDDKFIFLLTKASNSGAISFDEGNIVSFIEKDEIPESKKLIDKNNLATAVISYDLNLEANESKEIIIAVPFYKNNLGDIQFNSENYNIELAHKLLDETINLWDKKLTHVKFELPSTAEKLVNVYRSNLAYILINRDKAGIQPGSRSYERSWIRDGALTSSALLKSGIVDEVRKFIEWYSDNLFETGKVPCVVDKRGPDPVPENDSHGEYIFLLKQYFNFTKDYAFLTKYNSKIIKTVNYIKKLIDERSTDYFMNSNDSIRAFYGLVPGSISHEGYSAKPMHSYWDDFFTLRGLKDATEIQKIIGNNTEYHRMIKMRDKFKEDLYNSIQLTIKTKKIKYIPGCAELGDFDATSTTIAISPVNELNNLPQPYLNQTFEKYYNFFEKRKNGEIDWTNYTPYEVRTVGSFIYLNKPKIAHELLNFFLKDQKPNLENEGWNHWAEVVWKDDRFPGFIGDMPHTWVGSDFINAFLSMFVYENEYDSTLVIASAIDSSWFNSTNMIKVENLPTSYGEISYKINHEGNKYSFFIFGNFNVPANGIELKYFDNYNITPSKIYINGNMVSNDLNSPIIVNEIPALVEVYY